MQCHKCNDPNKIEADFYKGTKTCKACLRIAQREQILRRAQREDPEKAARIIAYRKRREDRGPQPPGHHWCSKCLQFHLDEEFSNHARNHHGWCQNCNTIYATNRTRELKKRAIEHLGGACHRCGFDKHWAAFVFHHPDPSVKEMDWHGMQGQTWENLLPELEKCVLLCACCHLVVHCALDDQGNPNPEYIPIPTKGHRSVMMPIARPAL